MKKLEKLKKNYVINTLFLDKYDFNEPVYLQDANKENVTVYSTNNRTKKVVLKTIKIDEILNTKTFITVKEFFKKCKKDNTEYKIEKVGNDTIFIRVAYFNDLSLFYKISLYKNTSSFVLTNINKYKFYKTTHNIYDALNKIKLNILEVDRIANYLSNLKNIKRDYLFYLDKSKEKLEKQVNEN